MGARLGRRDCPQTQGTQLPGTVTSSADRLGFGSKINGTHTLGFRESDSRSRKWTLVCTVPRFSQPLYRYKPKCISDSRNRIPENPVPCLRKRAVPKFFRVVCAAVCGGPGDRGLPGLCRSHEGGRTEGTVFLITFGSGN